MLEPKSSLKSHTVEEFVNYAVKFSTVVSELVQTQQFDMKLFFTGPYSVKHILIRNHRLAMLKEIYKKYRDNPKEFAIETEGKVVRDNES